MNRLDSLYDTTKEIIKTLNKTYTDVDDRTEIISKVNELLEQRGAILEEIKPPYTAEEESIGKKVVIMDQKIRKKMDDLYKAVQTDLRKLKQKKDSNKTYMNPYKGMKIVDGMYMDDKL